MRMSAIIETKSFAFSVRIVKLYKHLCEEKKEYVLSRQILRAGTGIGANVAEAQQAQSRPDFISKLCIALKEAGETDYWLRLLRATDYLSENEYDSLIIDCKELEKLLTTIIKSKKHSHIIYQAIRIRIYNNCIRSKMFTSFV